MSLGITEGRLQECPKSPNCVSTQAAEPEKRMPVLPFKGDQKQSLEKLLMVLNNMPRTKIVEQKDNYLHVEFKSAFFRFVDDVEFFFDSENGAIQFRSASRTGYSDLGVNRKRMTAISEAYLAG